MVMMEPGMQPEIGMEPETQPEVRLTPEQYSRILSEVASIPAAQLRQVLSRHLLLLEEEGEEEAEEEVDELPDQMREVFEETPTEDASADEDDDFSEQEDDFSPLLATEEDLWKPREQVDIIVALIEGQLKVYSGLSDLLVTIKDSDYLGEVYRNALRYRIVVSMAIAHRIAERNEQFFRAPSGNNQLPPNPLTQQEILRDFSQLLGGSKRAKGYLSRLVNTCVIRTPYGSHIPMSNFFQRARPQHRKIVTLELIKEILSEENELRTYTDREIAQEILNRLPMRIGQQINEDSLRVIVCKIRKSHNIPDWKERKKLYEQGKILDNIINR